MLIPIDEVVYFDVVTHTASTGTSTNADSSGTYEVYEEATDTAILTAQALVLRAGQTGVYRGSFTASAANGFEAGKWYSVVAASTVATIAGKAVAMHFRCCPAETVAGVPKVDPSTWDGTDITTGVPLAPTVAGRTLDVAATGEAGLDFANITSGAASVLALAQIRINAAAAGGGIDIDNSAGPAISTISTSGAGVEAIGSEAGLTVSGSGNGHGAQLLGAGTGSGLVVESDDPSDADAVKISAYGAGTGVRVYNNDDGPGVYIHGGTDQPGLWTAGSGNGTGWYSESEGTGPGVEFEGGPTSGAGMVVTAQAGNSDGATFIATGTGKDIRADELITAAQVNAEVVDALNVDTYAEIGQEAPAATQTLRKMLGYLYKAWRNRSTQSLTGDYKL